MVLLKQPPHPFSQGRFQAGDLQIQGLAVFGAELKELTEQHQRLAIKIELSVHGERSRSQ
ncbi:hypothetical protein [uncultured Aquimonas sp.]|uniref:hypothetical protein n=1 Tax=uncultured Aquimonas sp. TaxID=385483 RepID=UPI002603C28A|nr:hypothetical protein [uncultured Aquimonas sp.]